MEALKLNSEDRKLLQFMDDIELTWTRATQRRFSVTDVETIVELQAAAISLNAIRAGIIRTLNNFRPKYRGDVVKMVSYCLPEIVKAHKAELELKAGPER